MPMHLNKQEVQLLGLTTVLDWCMPEHEEDQP